MAKIIAKIIQFFGGAKAIKKIVLDLLVKILIKDVIKPKEFAKEIHDAVQDKGASLLSLKQYERVEKNVLEPFAAELLSLWKKD